MEFPKIIGRCKTGMFFKRSVKIRDIVKAALKTNLRNRQFALNNQSAGITYAHIADIL
jgi:hypothetical protein